MSRVLKIDNSSYRIRVQDGGAIYLDTGPNNNGDVIITGNLTVIGTTSTVESSNTFIKDNIIELNAGEVGAGITDSSHMSGLMINRGSLPNAYVVFDESVQHYTPDTNTNIDGTFVFKTVQGSTTKLSGIQVNSITTDTSSNLIFDLRNSNKVMKIANINASSYSSLVLSDNDIPNKYYVDHFFSSGVFSVNGIFSENTSMKAYSDSIKIKIADSNPDPDHAIGRFESTGFTYQNIKLQSDTITTVTGTDKLILTSDGTIVQVDGILELTDQDIADLTSTDSGITKIYSKVNSGNSDIWDTGVYVINESNTIAQELISKNRALLYSMLF